MSRILLFLLVFLAPGVFTAQELSRSGLLIDNGFRRGYSFTDSEGSSYYLRDIPVTITNDSTIPIYLEIVFAQEYDYPAAYRDKTFNIIPLPQASAYSEIQNYIDRPILQTTVEPGETLVIGIATIYPKPPEDSGVLPHALFEQNNEGTSSACDWLIGEKSISNSKIALGLKLVFTDGCMRIPCGHISYPEP
ncbi:MAG: hypothetical protein AAF587_42655 [Bacteroidota bacterium]